MFLLVCVILVLFPEGAMTGAREGVQTAFENVIPAILPFSVLSAAVVYSGTIDKISKLCEPFFLKIGINPYGGTAFLTSLLSGYPNGCKMVCDMYSEQLIDKDECEKMLAFVNNGGLIFALSIVGKMGFMSKKAGGIIFFACAAASLITGIIMSHGRIKSRIFVKTKKLSLWAAMGKSISSGGNVIINITSSLIVFYAVGRALELEKYPVLFGIWEMTKGIEYAGEAKNAALAAFFFAFGGLSVMAQTAAICSEHDISLKWYIKGKLMSSAIAFVIMCIFENVMNRGYDILLLAFMGICIIVPAALIIKKMYRKAFWTRQI